MRTPRSPSRLSLLAPVVLLATGCAFADYDQPRTPRGDGYKYEPGVLAVLNDAWLSNPIAANTAMVGNIVGGAPAVIVFFPFALIEDAIAGESPLYHGTIAAFGYLGGFIVGTPFLILTLPWSLVSDFRAYPPRGSTDVEEAEHEHEDEE